MERRQLGPLERVRFLLGMKRPQSQNSRGFSFEEDKNVSKWRSNIVARLEIRVALFVLLVSFVGGCISCFIVYNRSIDQVFETRVEHVRDATASLGRSINPENQRAIVKTPSKSSSSYVATKRTLQHFLKTFTNAFRAYTVDLKNGKTRFIVDGGQRARSGELHHSANINQLFNSPSKELLKCFSRGVPTVERTPHSSELGSYVGSYYPIKSKSGKVTAVLGVDMKFDGFEEDCDALLGSFIYGLAATGFVSVLLAFISFIVLLFSRREHGHLQAEVLNQKKRVDSTREELTMALSNCERETDSLIQTLSGARCIVWNGKAFRSPGRLDWEATLEYEAPFDWLASDLASGQKFAEIWNDRRDPDDQNVWEKLLGFAFDRKLSTTTIEYRINVTDVHSLWFEEQLDFEFEPDGSVSIHGFVRDVTDAKKRNDEIRKLAYYDTVTGLINRARIHEVINEMLLNNPTVSIIGIEVNNLRDVNESWGAEIADKMLSEFGSQLVASVGHSGIVGRLGGDDFVIIVADQHILASLVDLVGKACLKPTFVNGVEIHKDCRLGYVTAANNDSALSLLRKATLALEHARKNQNGLPVVYESEMSFKSKMRVELETAIRQALTDGEFYLMFQPIYCNKTKKLVKAEALLRWNSSRFGPISPAIFIPIAEESDFINDLGKFVIDETAKAVHNFIAETGQEDIVISFNMSQLQLRNETTLALLEQTLTKWKISYKNLMVEITESSIMQDSGGCLEMLDKLKLAGFSLAIDDFGTGYSSLATLASLPFDCMKIDKRFVDGIAIDKKQENVLETIVRLARALNLQIVAEGIEHESQWEFLSGLGVEYSQGYYFARPLSFEEFIAAGNEGMESIGTAA